MALLSRARTAAVAGAAALAVALPLAPQTTAPAAAAPTPVAATLAASAPAVVPSVLTRAEKRRKVMRTAHSLKGVPYVYGGSTPSGFDCSGFTMYVYRKVGVTLTHSATAQMYKARRISRSNARRGDLVFFRSGSRAYHVGIYAGRNRVLHSPRPGQVVHRTRIWTSNVTFGRVL